MLICFEVPFVENIDFNMIKFRFNDEQLGQKLVGLFERSLIPSNIRCSHSEVFPCVNCLNLSIRNISKDLFDKACPIVEKRIRIRDGSRNWYSADVREAKRKMRKAEKKCKQYITEEYLSEYKRLRQLKCNAVDAAKRIYYSSKFEKCGTDSKKLYNQLNTMLGRKDSSKILPFFEFERNTCQSVLKKIAEKIEKIVADFTLYDSPEAEIVPDFPLKIMNVFPPITYESVLKLVR